MTSKSHRNKKHKKWKEAQNKKPRVQTRVFLLLLLLGLLTLTLMYSAEGGLATSTQGTLNLRGGNNTVNVSVGSLNTVFSCIDGNNAQLYYTENYNVTVADCQPYLTCNTNISYDTLATNIINSTWFSSCIDAKNNLSTALNDCTSQITTKDNANTDCFTDKGEIQTENANLKRDVNWLLVALAVSIIITLIISYNRIFQQIIPPVGGTTWIPNSQI